MGLGIHLMVNYSIIVVIDFLDSNRCLDIRDLYLCHSVGNRINRSHKEYQLVIDSKLITKVKY